MGPEKHKQQQQNSLLYGNWLGQGERDLQSSHFRIKKHYFEPDFDNNADIKKLKKKKKIVALFMDGIQLLQG